MKMAQNFVQRSKNVTVVTSLVKAAMRLGVLKAVSELLMKNTIATVAILCAV